MNFIQRERVKQSMRSWMTEYLYKHERKNCKIYDMINFTLAW